MRRSFLLDLLSFRGRTSRSVYLLSGSVLMVIKFLLDHTIASHFGQPWSPAAYFLPPRDPAIFTLRGEHRDLYLLLWAVALPFFWIGVSLTLRRLRDAGLRTGWVALFFVPVANLLFFLLLSVLPSEQPVPEGDGPVARGTARLAEGAIFGVLIAAALGLLLVAYSANVLLTYGWGLFLGVPFLIGFVASWFLNVRQLHSRAQSMGLACVSMLVVAFALIGFRFEGLVCLVMAIPLALPLAIGGALAAHTCLSHRARLRPTGSVTACVAVLPLLLFGEHAASPTPPIRPVVTSVVIHAPVHTVWQNVIAFPPLATPTELVFRSGIAYPIGATITGTGVGAVRRCRFSTGDFVEPITTWDTDRLLAFNVASEPPSLNEIGFGPIHTPHNDRNYMRSSHGQFRLVALDADHTLLEGTTWYQDFFWPQPYWRSWSDAIVHRIHRRVLEHVREQAEAQANE